MLCLRAAGYDYEKCLLHDASLHVKGKVAIVCVASGHLCVTAIWLLAMWGEHTFSI